jgi:hypothetical protein
MPSKPSRRKSRVDNSFNPAIYFSEKLGIPEGYTSNILDTLVNDYNYLTKELPQTYDESTATIRILSQIGYNVDMKYLIEKAREFRSYGDAYGDKSVTDTITYDGINHINPHLLVELSNKNTYSISGKNVGHYDGMLEDSITCDKYPFYPFPCSKHILKFKNEKGSVHYLPPFDPETNTPEEDYIQVYTVNDKHYVHHSTGLVIDSKHKGGRRTRRRSKRSV